ncbi:MAG: hypothetical protein ACOY3P_06700 [Planctomycetota bacterium]
MNRARAMEWALFLAKLGVLAASFLLLVVLVVAALEFERGWQIFSRRWMEVCFAVTGLVLIYLAYLTYRVVRRRFQYTLRELLIVTLLLAVLLGFWGKIAAGGAVARAGATLIYSGEDNDWAKKWLGYNPFRRVDSVYLPNDEALKAFLRYRHLLGDPDYISLESGISDEALAAASAIGRIRGLHTVGIDRFEMLTAAALQTISGWQQVERILIGGPFSIEGARHLAQMVGLRKIELHL